MNKLYEHLLEEINSTTSKKSQQFAIYKACPYSVSKIVEAVKAPFDKEAVAQKTHDKNYDNPYSEYYHMSVEQILENWEEKAKTGRENGKVLDSWIERILTPNINESMTNEEYLESLTEVQRNKCNQFIEFYNNNIVNKVDFVGRELMLFDKEKKINGRLDALFSLQIDESTDCLLLIDWKNSKNITVANSFEKMRGPLYKYDSCDLNGYTVQLYLYAYMLRNKYKVKNKIIPLIVRIGENDYEIYSPQIPYSDSLVDDIISYASEQINNLQIIKENNEKNIQSV